MRASKGAVVPRPSCVVVAVVAVVGALAETRRKPPPPHEPLYPRATSRRPLALHEWFDRLGGLTPIHGHLHRSPIPVLPEHFGALRRAGIGVVFSFEEAVPGHLAREAGLDWRPHFWTDDEPPTYAQMDRFLADYLTVPDATPTLMHCKAGWGRAGTALTCALVARHGFTAERALRHYWSRVPSAEAVMTGNGQAEFVRGYAASLRGRGLRA